MISQHEGTVVQHRAAEEAPLKALSIFYPLIGNGRGHSVGFILLEKNPGRYLTMFDPRWAILLKTGPQIS